MRRTTKGANISTAPLISIVDDEPAVRQAMQRLLRSLGYAVACFGSAEEYLTSPHRAHTECLILDVHMPGMTGVDLQARLLADGDRTPIVFISGVASDAIKNRAMQFGSRGFLSKPVRSSLLTDLIEKVLGRDAAKKTVDRYKSAS